KPMPAPATVVSRNIFFSCLIVFLVSSSLLLSFPLPSRAQADQGAITGTIQDQQGGIIAAATVTLYNPDTGLSLERRTNASGVYVFAPVKVGRYTVRVSAPGFAVSVRESVQ